MKIALISTPTRTYAPNYVPPLGVMYLAGHLRNQGHTVTILDLAKTRQSPESVIKELKVFEPEVIGVSAIITAYHFVKELVINLKTNFPDSPVVIGGHITLDNTDMLLRDIKADYVIQGYGELKFSKLVDYLSGKIPIKEVPSLSYERNVEIITNHNDLFFKSIDECPLPAYDLVDMEYYITITKSFPKLEAYLKKNNKPAPPARSFVVIGARGCTDLCSFCVHEFDRQGFKVHSVEYIVKNIRVLYEQYGVRIFFIGEDLFLTNVRYARAFVRAINENFPDAYFQFSTRADYVKEELLLEIEKSNGFALVYGFESGSNYILKMLGKRMDRGTNISAYKSILSHGIIPACSFMVGTPGETQITIQETIDAIKEAGITEGAVFFTAPYPGSRIYKWCIESGTIGSKSEFLETISDRDATKMSINFTPYPDIIVKMMKIMVENAIEDNKARIAPEYKTTIVRRILNHIIIPLIYNGYFVLYKSGKKTIDYELNRKGTLKLLGEM